MTAERVRPSQLVMHPGPMNRGIELSSAVADAPNSAIAEQVRSGLAARMAVLHDLVTEPVSGPGEAALRVVADPVPARAGQEVA